MTLTKIILESITIFIEYITWQVVCLIIFWRLAKPLSKFINNIKSVSAGSFGFHAQNINTNSNKFSESLQNDANLPDVIAAEKKLVESALEKLDLGTETAEKEHLIRELAFAHMVINFEAIHGAIFYSQIYLLRQLRGNENGFDANTVENVFNTFKEAKPEQSNNFTFDRYVKFLLDSQLIEIQENNYFITEMGLEYLKWITIDGKMEKTYG